jgi:DNA-nicking Smr family endonuclease
MRKPADTPAAPPNEEDAALFREAIGEVRRVHGQAPAPQKPRPRPRARMAEHDERAALSEFQRGLEAMPIEAGDTLSYHRDELPARIWQRLKRGQFSIQDELDLHGATAAQAERLLRLFLREAQRSGTACIRIVHGKGLGSEADIPVLKNVVDRVLRQRADVLGFHSAIAAQGGTGAVIVLLGARRPGQL